MLQGTTGALIGWGGRTGGCTVVVTQPWRVWRETLEASRWRLVKNSVVAKQCVSDMMQHPDELSKHHRVVNYPAGWLVRSSYDSEK